jgi:hypothetical protein
MSFFTSEPQHVKNQNEAIAPLQDAMFKNKTFNHSKTELQEAHESVEWK